MWSGPHGLTKWPTRTQKRRLRLTFQLSLKSLYRLCIKGFRFVVKVLKPRYTVDVSENVQ